MVADPPRGRFGPPRWASRSIHPKSHSFRHEDPIGCSLSSATLTFTPIKSFLAFLTLCGFRLSLLCACSTVRIPRPAARLFPTPGALRLRTSSRHALLITLADFALCSAVTGAVASGAVVCNFIHLAMAMQLWYTAAAWPRCSFTFLCPDPRPRFASAPLVCVSLPSFVVQGCALACMLLSGSLYPRPELRGGRMRQRR